MCKMDKGSCNEKCLEVDDVSTLHREGATENDVFPNRYCTAHQCPHNPTGLKCEIDRCRFGRVKS